MKEAHTHITDDEMLRCEVCLKEVIHKANEEQKKLSNK